MSAVADPPDFRGPEDNIFEAVLRLRHAFLHSGLEPPAVIELASWDEGMKLLQLARSRYSDRYRRSLFRRRGGDDLVTEIEISGITVRWPDRGLSRGPITIDAE